MASAVRVQVPPLAPQEGGNTISHLVIDGYNVIGTLHKDLQKVRDEFVSMLVKYRRIRGHEVTVVFDGHGGFSSKDTVQKTGSIEVVYTATGKTADQYIKDMLMRNPSMHYIVVSSDRDIARAAFRAGSVAVPSEAFWQRLEDALQGLPPSEIKHPRGHSPSKKEKAIIRALKKL